MRISDWSSDVCSSDLDRQAQEPRHVRHQGRRAEARARNPVFQAALERMAFANPCSRESGSPGAAGDAFSTLDPRFRGGTLMSRDARNSLYYLDIGIRSEERRERQSVVEGKRGSER